MTHFNEAEIKHLESQVYKVSNRFNRTGLTLEGTPLLIVESSINHFKC